jgi:hypothetical protein
MTGRPLFGMVRHMVVAEIEALVKMNLVGDDVEQIARVLGRAVAAWWDKRGRIVMRRCPGCGSQGDIEHIVSCAGARLGEARKEGAARMLAMVEKQIARRGEVAEGRLAAALLWGRWREGGSW